MKKHIVQSIKHCVLYIVMFVLLYYAPYKLAQRNYLFIELVRITHAISACYMAAKIADKKYPV